MAQPKLKKIDWAKAKKKLAGPINGSAISPVKFLPNQMLETNYGCWPSFRLFPKTNCCKNYDFVPLPFSSHRD
jgi:hypothetical protein